MKRQTQQAGVRDWYGDDLVSLQAEPLKIIDGFLAQYVGCVLAGCQVTANGSKYDVAPGLVALRGTDPEGKAVSMVVPFEGTTSPQALPLYLTLVCEVVSATYGDGRDKPVAHDYKAVASSVRPEGDHLEIKASGAPRFEDVMQDSTHRFITDTERTAWNAKETPSGAQDKAVAALTLAQKHTDTREKVIRTDMTTKDGETLASSKKYTDDREAAIKTAIVDSAPSDLSTLKKLATAVTSKEIPSGAQSKADSAYSAACRYSDGYLAQFKAEIRDSAPSDLNTLGKLATAVNSKETPSGAQAKTDSVWTSAKEYTAARVNAIVGSAPSDLNTLGKLATAVTGNVSKSFTGYAKFPNGVMIEWGKCYERSHKESEEVKITFPCAFNNIFSFSGIVEMMGYTVGTSITLHAWSLGCEFALIKPRTYTAGLAIEPFWWIAIGTWK